MLKAPSNLPKKGEKVPLSRVLELCREYRLFHLEQQIENDPPSRPFVSDGCSRFPDRLPGKNLYPWCFGHDLFYWAGKPGDHFGRLRADTWLMLRIAENVSIELAETMFNGVRLGGVEWLPAPWRWGYGRKTFRLDLF